MLLLVCLGVATCGRISRKAGQIIEPVFPTARSFFRVLCFQGRVPEWLGGVARPEWLFGLLACLRGAASRLRKSWRAGQTTEFIPVIAHTVFRVLGRSVRGPIGAQKRIVRIPDDSSACERVVRVWRIRLIAFRDVRLRA